MALLKLKAYIKRDDSELDISVNKLGFWLTVKEKGKKGANTWVPAFDESWAEDELPDLLLEVHKFLSVKKKAVIEVPDSVDQNTPHILVLVYKKDGSIKMTLKEREKKRSISLSEDELKEIVQALEEFFVLYG